MDRGILIEEGVLCFCQIVAFGLAAFVIFRKNIVPIIIKRLTIEGCLFSNAYLVAIATQHSYFWISLTAMLIAHSTWGLFYWSFAVEYLAMATQIDAKLHQSPKTDKLAYFVQLEKFIAAAYLIALIGVSIYEAVIYIKSDGKKTLWCYTELTVTGMCLLCTFFMLSAIWKILKNTRRAKSVRTSRKVWFHVLVFSIMTAGMVVNLFYY